MGRHRGREDGKDREGALFAIQGALECTSMVGR